MTIEKYFMTFFIFFYDKFRFFSIFVENKTRLWKSRSQKNALRT